MNTLDFLDIIQILPAIIIGLTFHEFAHAYIAYRCGDTTAKDLGRVTLNPIKHIDPFGFLLLLIAWFWWAKPVIFNENKLKNRNSDVIKIALAWPLANAILAIVFSLVYVIVMTFISESDFDTYSFFIGMLYYGIFINWGLFVFNLLPIPPLDGSHVFLSKYKKYPFYAEMEKWWIMGLFVLFMAENQTGVDILPIGPVIRFLGECSLKLFGY